MEIHPIESESEWTSFFNTAGSPSFHHAWEWGVFQQSMGYEIQRLGLYDEKRTLVSIALVIHIKARRGNFLFIPHGPLFSTPTIDLAYQEDQTKHLPIDQYLQIYVRYLATYGRKHGCRFIRIAPVFTDTPYHHKLMSLAGFRTAPIYMHAESLWVLDVSQTDEELLAQMRKNCRYGIRKGLKDEIQTVHDISDTAPDIFWDMYNETFKRESFAPFSRTYITKEFQAFRRSQNALFIFGELPSKFDQEGRSRFTAASLIIFTKSSAFYHQGASIHTSQPVPYMVQWATIQEAKRRGCRYYNLYGIYHPGRTPASWEGLTLFKKGFGGFELNYLPTQDYILSPGYWITYVYERYLSWRRGVK